MYRMALAMLRIFVAGARFCDSPLSPRALCCIALHPTARWVSVSTRGEQQTCNSGLQCSRCSAHLQLLSSAAAAATKRLSLTTTSSSQQACGSERRWPRTVKDVPEVLRCAAGHLHIVYLRWQQSRRVNGCTAVQTLIVRETSSECTTSSPGSRPYKKHAISRLTPAAGLHRARAAAASQAPAMSERRKSSPGACRPCFTGWSGCPAEPVVSSKSFRGTLRSSCCLAHSHSHVHSIHVHA